MNAVESILLKLTKYLELGESKSAFHGIRLPSFLFFIILICSGCSWFADNRVIVKPKIDTTSPEYKEMLSKIINSRYDSEYLRIASADLAYQEYLLNKEAKKTNLSNQKSPEF